VQIGSTEGESNEEAHKSLRQPLDIAGLKRQIEDAIQEAVGYARRGFDLFKAPVYTDATRPSAGTAGRIIFNSDDGQLNIDNGTNWTLPDGTVT